MVPTASSSVILPETVALTMQAQEKHPALTVKVMSYSWEADSPRNLVISWLLPMFRQVFELKTPQTQQLNGFAWLTVKVLAFAESYSSASEYNPDSIKYTSDGDVVSYLKDDVIKVPAHWSSPGSYLFLKANADVPRGMSLADVFAQDANGESLYIGDGKYFDFVGKDSSNQGGNPSKPTTEYIRANINLAEPSMYAPGATALLNTITSNANNGNLPKYVKNGNDIYTPAYDWDLKEFNPLFSYNYGDYVFVDDPANTSDQVLQMSSAVKVTWGCWYLCYQ